MWLLGNMRRSEIQPQLDFTLRQSREADTPGIAVEASFRLPRAIQGCTVNLGHKVSFTTNLVP